MRLSDLHKRVIASKKELLLLDAFPNAAAAYSLRKLRNAYTGNCIEVRRSSDNALQNIGFVNNVLDTASLLSFVGAGDGFVRTWYDQSGLNRNAIQTDNAKQLLIVVGGVVIENNGFPTLQTTGLTACGFAPFSNSLLKFTHESQATWSIVLNQVGNPQVFSRSTGNISQNQRGFQWSNSTSTPAVIANASGTEYVVSHNQIMPRVIGTPYIYFWNYDLSKTVLAEKSTLKANTTNIGLDSTQNAAPSIGNSSLNFSIIGIQDNRFYAQAKYTEWILWNVRYGDDLQNKINDYYSIY